MYQNDTKYSVLQVPLKIFSENIPQYRNNVGYTDKSYIITYIDGTVALVLSSVSCSSRCIQFNEMTSDRPKFENMACNTMTSS